jgi:hypothetical protein
MPTVADELCTSQLEKPIQVRFGDVVVLLGTRGHSSVIIGCGLIGIPCNKNTVPQVRVRSLDANQARLFTSQEWQGGGIMFPPSEPIELKRSMIHAARKQGRVPVTVCVAAMCAENILIGASDRMLTAGDVEFEPDTAKIYSLSNSAVAMIAGEASLQIEILQSLYRFVGERI